MTTPDDPAARRWAALWKAKARAGLACPACAEGLRRQGWAVVRRGRGGEGT